MPGLDIVAATTSGSPLSLAPFSAALKNIRTSSAISALTATDRHPYTIPADGEANGRKCSSASSQGARERKDNNQSRLRGSRPDRPISPGGVLLKPDRFYSHGDPQPASAA